MTRRRIPASFAPALAGLLLVAAAGCGKKGPPLAPLQVVPARVDDLTARRLGDDVYLRFTVPSANSDNKRPADVVAVEALAITGEPVDVNGDSLDARRLMLEVKPVARLEVQPPPPPETAEQRERRMKEEDERRARGEPPPPPPVVPPDPRPRQGEMVTMMERLRPEVLTPYVPHLGRKRPPPPPRLLIDDREWPMPPVHLEPAPLRRVYVAVGRSRKGRAGPPSARVGVPLIDLPPTPPAPVLRHTESAIVIEWTPAPGTRQPIVQATGDPESHPVRLLMPGRPPHTFNVYEPAPDVPPAGPGAAMPVAPQPLNVAPLTATVFEDTRLQFGVERCYVVRTVEVATNVTVESPASPAACITPTDVFPPAAPKSLAAVGSEGAINLIWEANTDSDLAGYIVLRGEAGGSGPLTALTPAPIKETTYRDTAVVAGTRYVYAIVAVDTATPQNVSVESNRVEETAR